MENAMKKMIEAAEIFSDHYCITCDEMDELYAMLNDYTYRYDEFDTHEEYQLEEDFCEKFYQVIDNIRNG